MSCLIPANTLVNLNTFLFFNADSIMISLRHLSFSKQKQAPFVVPGRRSLSGFQYFFHQCYGGVGRRHASCRLEPYGADSPFETLARLAPQGERIVRTDQYCTVVAFIELAFFKKIYPPLIALIRIFCMFNFVKKLSKKYIKHAPQN